jgi:poly(hydroxyalkanoate) depolymerase family esterase
MRTLVRSATKQQSALVKLLGGYAAPSKKRPRKPAPRKSPTSTTVQGLPLAAGGERRASPPQAPGQWLAGLYPLPLSPGQAVPHSMPYWLYLPHRLPDTPAGQGWPLIVMLHGCQQDATQFAQGTRMNQLAEDKACAVLYPQQAIGVQAQRCWRWYDRSTQQGDGDTAALAALIESVCGQYRIDRRRIFACGLSAGAGMAAVLALNHPELIAAVGLHSGPVFGAGHTALGALHVMRHGALQSGAAIVGLMARRAAQTSAGVTGPMPLMPALMIQGDDDQVVRPINQQQLARQWLQLNGLPDGPAARVTTKPAGRRGSRNAHEIHDYLIKRKLVLRVVRIAGLNHAWSGGDPAFRFNAKAGPNASRMMLDFFGRHWR